MACFRILGRGSDFSKKGQHKIKREAGQKWRKTYQKQQNF